MFCCYSAAVAIPKLGLYALDAASFSNYGMFTCLIVVNVWFYFCNKRWADVYVAYSAGVFHFFVSYRFLARDRVDCPE